MSTKVYAEEWLDVKKVRKKTDAEFTRTAINTAHFAYIDNYLFCNRTQMNTDKE